MQETTIISQWNFEIRKGKWAIIYIRASICFCSYNCWIL